jgi:hypothetical protein
MRLPAYVAALALGIAAGTAAVAVHRSGPGLLLGVATALVTVGALRQWLRPAAAWFAAGWLVPLVTGLSGRAEGDYVVGDDLSGMLLIAAGFVVLLAGVVSAARHDSGSRRPRT